MKTDAIGMGLIAIDHIFLEAPNKKLEYIGSSGGGSVGNTLTFLGALGFKTAIIGAIGDDIHSDIIKQDFKDFKVATRLIIRKGTIGNFRRSRQYFHIITLKTHKHRFVQTCPGCKSMIEKKIVFLKNDITSDMIDAIQDSTIFHVDRANDASISLARRILQNKGIVSYDFSFDSYENTRSKSKELLSLSTILKINSDTFNRFINTNKLKDMKEFSDSFENIRLLAITDGQNGVRGYIRGTKTKIKEFNYPAIQCNNVQDASGAGDIFIGMIIAQLLNKTSYLEVGCEKDLIGLSQAIASLSCCFYGARSYQRIIMKNGISFSDLLNLGKEILKNELASCSLPPKSGIPIQYKAPYRFDVYEKCQYCGSTMTQRLLSKKNQNGFGQKLAETHLPMSEAFFAAIKRRNKLNLEINNASMLFVGSGGSFSAATFGEETMLSLRGISTNALTPYELRSIAAPLDKIIPCIISYGGENNDILYAFERMRALKCPKGIVITANANSRLGKWAAESGWNVFLVPQVQGRIGHLATIGYLVTLSTLSAILAPKEYEPELYDFFELENLLRISKSADIKARELASRLERKPSDYHFIGLASGWGKPALVDLESKIVEGGISTIECSEFKNFTHGRYINAYRHRKNRIALLLKCPPYEDLVDFIKKKLEKQMMVFELATEKPFIPGALELVIQILYLTHHLGLKEGIDISKPKYPKEAKGLYGWTPTENGLHEFLLQNK